MNNLRYIVVKDLSNYRPASRRSIPGSWPEARVSAGLRGARPRCSVRTGGAPSHARRRTTTRSMRVGLCHQRSAMDESVGMAHPENRAAFTARLNRNGTVAMGVGG